MCFTPAPGGSEAQVVNRHALDDDSEISWPGADVHGSERAAGVGSEKGE